jgi:hypothetical protein
MLKDATKICTKCKFEKDLQSFHTRKQSKDGLAFWCRECFKSHWKKRYYENHEHYRNNHSESRSKLREQNARKVFEYLATHPCLICGECDPIVLEFDHRVRSDKIESVSMLIRNSSWKRIELEIQKCDVLCANCHRRKTAAQFKYKRHLFVNS